MTDPDDVTAVMLEYAIRDFCIAAQKLAQPSIAINDFVMTYLAARMAVAAESYSNEQLLLLVARRLTQDINTGL